MATPSGITLKAIGFAASLAFGAYAHAADPVAPRVAPPCYCFTKASMSR